MDNGEFSTYILSKKAKMFRLAKSILYDGAEAEDAVQDVFERLWIRRTDLSELENLDAFIMVSVKNTCLDRIRKRKLRDEKNAQITREAVSYSDNTVPMEMKDMKVIVEKIISLLPERQKIVIHLRDVEGCETSEISRILEMDEATVRMTLSRARKAVREKFLKIAKHGI